MLHNAPDDVDPVRCAGEHHLMDSLCDIVCFCLPRRMLLGDFFRLYSTFFRLPGPDVSPLKLLAWNGQLLGCSVFECLLEPDMSI